MLLDLAMPDCDGYEVMRRIRDRVDIPVILLTAKSSDGDKVTGLELGADDYLAKPFSLEELTARVRAVLRRSAGAHEGEHIVTAGHLSIDLHRRTVTRSGDPVDLTRTEWRLLQHLVANPGRVMLNTELLARIWGPEYREDLQYLRVWISRLRKKLEIDPASPEFIKTHAGFGYVFDPAPESVDESPESVDESEESSDEGQLAPAL